jgi:hypothetical protein
MTTAEQREGIGLFFKTAGLIFVMIPLSSLSSSRRVRFAEPIASESNPSEENNVLICEQEASEEQDEADGEDHDETTHVRLGCVVCCGGMLCMLTVFTTAALTWILITQKFTW